MPQDVNIMSHPCAVRITSVAGHLLNMDFEQPYNKWDSCHPRDLFRAPIKKTPTARSKQLVQHLVREAKRCDVKGSHSMQAISRACRSSCYGWTVTERARILLLKL